MGAKVKADTILELLHGVLFDRLRGLPDTSIRLVLSPRLAPFWQSISQAASDYREQINSMDSVTVVGELRGKVGDGVNQAAGLISATVSIPSLNFIPLTTFGNWF